MIKHEGDSRTEVSLSSIVIQSIDRFYLANDGNDGDGQIVSPREAALSIIEQLNRRGLKPVEILQIAMCKSFFEPCDLITLESLDDAESWDQLVNGITAEIVLLEMLESEPSLNSFERFVEQDEDDFEFSDN